MDADEEAEWIQAEEEEATALALAQHQQQVDPLSDFSLVFDVYLCIDY
jgi:hypothetical protein